MTSAKEFWRPIAAPNPQPNIFGDESPFHKPSQTKMATGFAEHPLLEELRVLLDLVVRIGVREFFTNPHPEAHAIVQQHVAVFAELGLFLARTWH